MRLNEYIFAKGKQRKTVLQKFSKTVLHDLLIFT